MQYYHQWVQRTSPGIPSEFHCPTELIVWIIESNEVDQESVLCFLVVVVFYTINQTGIIDLKNGSIRRSVMTEKFTEVAAETRCCLLQNVLFKVSFLACVCEIVCLS